MKSPRRLTGNFMFKHTVLGMVLYVECSHVHAAFAGDDSPDVKIWNKATRTEAKFIEESFVLLKNLSKVKVNK
jgi:hypothetical protein